MRLVIFDCDGTLVDSQHAICAAMTHAFTALALPVPARAQILGIVGLSLPQFWVGLVLILVFSVTLGWLPSSGSGTFLHLLMPAFTLGWYFAAAHMRLTRSSPSFHRR